MDLDKNCENLFNDLKVKWLQTNKFGIDLNHRKRFKWAYKWNELIQSDEKSSKLHCKVMKIKNNYNDKD